MNMSEVLSIDRGITRLKRNPMIIAAARTHPTYGKAWSTLGRKLDTLTQDACVFHDDVALFGDFTGMVADESEGLRIAEADMTRYSTVTRTSINRRLALQGVAGAIALPAFSLRAQTRPLLKASDLANAVPAGW